MKRISSLLLALLLFATSLIVGVNAYAKGIVDYAVPITFGTVYSESDDPSDPKSPFSDYSGQYSREVRYDAFKFVIPCKGQVTVRIECEDSLYLGEWVRLYKSTNFEKTYAIPQSKDGYDAGQGYYFENHTFTLDGGTYYFAMAYCQDWNRPEGEYNISFKFRPSFANTSITKVTPKKKSFTVKWKKASNVTGYEVQYSLKKNMKSSKKVKITKNSTVSKTVKKLKAKKKYYVRVRTYKTVKLNGKTYTYYGKWSATKNVKTK